MHPIKNHRIVRHGNATEGGVRMRREAAIESAENEGWPPQHSHSVLMESPLDADALATMPAASVLALQAR